MEKSEIFTTLDQIIKSNDVVLFMKGSTYFPQCGFSAAVVAILQRLGVKFEDVNVLESEEMRQGIKEYSDWPTIPQLYIKGEFIGGCDIVKELYHSGELQEIFRNKAITISEAIS